MGTRNFCFALRQAVIIGIDGKLGCTKLLPGLRNFGGSWSNLTNKRSKEENKREKETQNNHPLRFHKKRKKEKKKDWRVLARALNFENNRLMISVSFLLSSSSLSTTLRNGTGAIHNRKALYGIRGDYFLPETSSSSSSETETTPIVCLLLILCFELVTGINRETRIIFDEFQRWNKTSKREAREGNELCWGMLPIPFRQGNPFVHAVHHRPYSDGRSQEKRPQRLLL